MQPHKHTHKTKQKRKPRCVPRIELAIFLSSSPVETARAKLIEFGRAGATEVAAAAAAAEEEAIADDDVQRVDGGGGVVLSIIALDFFSF